MTAAPATAANIPKKGLEMNFMIFCVCNYRQTFEQSFKFSNLYCIFDHTTRQMFNRNPGNGLKNDASARFSTDSKTPFPFPERVLWAQKIGSREAASNLSVINKLLGTLLRLGGVLGLDDFDFGALFHFLGGGNLDDVARQWGGSLRRRRALGIQQFHFKDQRGIRRDATGALFAVSQIGGDEQFPFGTYRHFLQRFGPAMNDAVDPALPRFAAFVGAVKFGSVNERAAIVHGDGVVRAGRRTGAVGDDKVLQAVGKRLHAGLVLVGGQERVAF